MPTFLLADFDIFDKPLSECHYSACEFFLCPPDGGTKLTLVFSERALAASSMGLNDIVAIIKPSLSASVEWVFSTIFPLWMFPLCSTPTLPLTMLQKSSSTARSS